jgi:hypothetical protein
MSKLKENAKLLAPIANRITRLALKDLRELDLLRDPELLRDECDVRSGGDLDTYQLDILCDMVARRLQHYHTKKD